MKNLTEEIIEELKEKEWFSVTVTGDAGEIKETMTTISAETVAWLRSTIEKVRAEERERAAEIVESLMEDDEHWGVIVREIKLKP